MTNDTASSSDVSTSSASIAVRGVITSRAFFSENSNTPSISAASCRSSTPTSWLCSTRMRSSSAECTFSSALPGRSPNGRSTSSAERLSSQVNGCVIHANATSGGTSQRDTRSGLLIVAPRGASSPNTTWPYVTTDSAQMVPSVARAELRREAAGDAKSLRERVRQRLFGQRPDADARERDAELAGRQQPGKAGRRLEHEACLRVAGARHGLQARAARANDGELRRDEEAVQGEKSDDGKDASEHGRNVTDLRRTATAPGA